MPPGFIIQASSGAPHLSEPGKTFPRTKGSEKIKGFIPSRINL